MTWSSWDPLLINSRKLIWDGVVDDSHPISAQSERLRDEFQIPPSKHHDRRRAAKCRCDQALISLAPAAVIFGVIVIMQVKDVPQSERSCDGQKDDLANGAAAARDIDVSHTRRRKTCLKQCKNGNAKIYNGAEHHTAVTSRCTMGHEYPTTR